MEGDGIATLVDVHESEAAREWRARTELGELRTTREVRGVPVGTVGVAGCHEEHSGRLLEDALQAHGVILVEDEGAPADSVAGCIFGDGVVRHDQGWTVRILHEDAFDVLQLPIGNKTAIGLRPGRVDTENAEFTVVHGPAGLELVFGEDGLNGVEGHGGEHSEAVVVAADHVVVLLVLTEGREDTLQILSFFEFAVVAEVSIDEDVGDAATLHFGEHGGDHDFRPRGGVDGVATLADVDVVGDGYGLDVFASGLGEGGEDTGDFGLVDDVGEPESGFSFLPEGAAFEAVHSVGLEAADGDVVEAGLGVGLVDAAEGLFDVGAREPDLAIGGDTLVGEHMVGVGLFEGLQEKVMLVGVTVITSRSVTVTFSPRAAVGAAGMMALFTVAAEACGPGSVRLEATPKPRAAEPVKKDRRVIGEVVVSLILLKIVLLPTTCAKTNWQIT